MTAVLFETARLTARRLDAGDVDALLAVYGDPEVVRWVGDGEPLARAQCAEWVEVTERNLAMRGYGMVALVERAAGGPPFGFCGLVHPGGQPRCELKYALLRSHWGRGYATEAVQALLAHGAAAHGLTEVIATVAPQNEASQRVLSKAGLRRGTPRVDEDGRTTLVFVWQAPGARADA